MRPEKAERREKHRRKHRYGMRMVGAGLKTVILEGIRRGMQDRKEGKVTPWSVIKKRLGIEERESSGQ